MVTQGKDWRLERARYACGTGRRRLWDGPSGPQIDWSHSIKDPKYPSHWVDFLLWGRGEEWSAFVSEKGAVRAELWGRVSGGCKQSAWGRQSWGC